MMKGSGTTDNILIAFDLDDTLYKELDFVKSAFRAISRYLCTKYPLDSEYIYNILYSAFDKKQNPFDMLFSVLAERGFQITETIADLLAIYREHSPSLELDNETRRTLCRLRSEGRILGLITDGRSLTQRNKITALGLTGFFDNDNIIISEEFGSEKTDISNFRYFNDRYPSVKRIFYIGDNPKKDFLNPMKLGWKTLCLKDNGTNIHSQDFSGYIQPDYFINSLSLDEIFGIIQ